MALPQVTPQEFEAQNKRIVEHELYPQGTHVVVKLIQNDPMSDREGYVIYTHNSTRTYDIVFFGTDTVNELVPDIMYGVPHMLVKIKNELHDRRTHYCTIPAGGPRNLDYGLWRLNRGMLLQITRAYKADYEAKARKGAPPPIWIYNPAMSEPNVGGGAATAGGGATKAPESSDNGGGAIRLRI